MMVDMNLGNITPLYVGSPALITIAGDQSDGSAYSPELADRAQQAWRGRPFFQ